MRRRPPPSRRRPRRRLDGTALPTRASARRRPRRRRRPRPTAKAAEKAAEAKADTPRRRRRRPSRTRPRRQRRRRRRRSPRRTRRRRRPSRRRRRPRPRSRSARPACPSPRTCRPAGPRSGGAAETRFRRRRPPTHCPRRRPPTRCRRRRPRARSRPRRRRRPPEARPPRRRPPSPRCRRSSGAAINPAQFGGEEVGTGGSPDPEALALLKNKNVVLDDVGIADIKAGRIDPRVVAVLTKLSQEHEIKVSCMCSDHSKMTAGGSISNHFYGRGLDIAAIDGEIVNPGSTIAREVASELSSLDPELPPERDRLAVGDLRARLLHRRRPPGPPAHRLQGADHRGLEAARGRRRRGHAGGGAALRRRGRRCRAGRRRAPVAAARSQPPRRSRPAPPPKQESQLFLKAVTAEAASKQKEGQRLAAVPEGRRAAEARGRSRAGARPSTSPPSPRPRPTPTPATTRRRSRSPPGWPARPRSAACRPSCR